MAVYEAAIETLAHLTLEGTTDKYRLSLGGIYAPAESAQPRPFKPPAALESFLSRHPEVTEIEICTNNGRPWPPGGGGHPTTTTRTSTRSR